MNREPLDHTLEYLLGYDGLIHWLDRGYSLRFVIKKIRPTMPRPHGLRYSFTLHDGDGRRILGFDNAHRVPKAGAKYKTLAHIVDHWHRTTDDRGRPYGFVDAETLVEDFFREVYRELAKRGISADVVNVTRRKG
jgi:hypothetical protein